MLQFNDIGEAQSAVQRFARGHWTKLPEHVRDEFERFDGPGVSPVAHICDIAEVLYANRKARGVANKTTRELTAALASFAGMMGLMGMRDGRGARIALAMHRDNGEDAPTGGWPKPEDDPEPDARFAPVKEGPADGRPG